MKLKVCGVRDWDNIVAIAYLKPDLLGFNYYQDSKRFVGNDFKIPPIESAIKKVGVFVDSDLSYMLDACKKYDLDMVQLHGNESPAICQWLSEHKITVIKAFGIDEHFDFSMMTSYQPFSDYFLFDYKSPSYGGSGKRFDWDLLNKYDLSTPFFLSGGIGPEDAEQIIALKDSNLIGVDINSKFEKSAGYKDVELVNTFMQALKKLSNEKVKQK